MAEFTDFIPENIAPLGARRIGIYQQNGNRIGQLPLGNLTPPAVGERLYSFGALSDVHMQYETAPADFQTALTYLNQTADFVCVCGDLTTNGTAAELAVYKQHVDQYAKIPVYTIAGNHEGYHSGILSILETYTGTPLYYSFHHGNDVFIMLGVKSNTMGSLFADGELQWLYETLEDNRNKRCFVFQHVFPKSSALGLYHNSIWGGTEADIFVSLMQHYPNVILFHGHSHLRFDLQRKYGGKANYDRDLGCHSIHISSLASPRSTSSNGSGLVDVFSASEGYVVDVYKNGIHLRGREFADGAFLPIASYWLDTPLKTVEAKTYQDPTGTIQTGQS